MTHPESAESFLLRKREQRLRTEKIVTLKLRRDVLYYVMDYLNRNSDHGIVGTVLEPYMAHDEFKEAAEKGLSS